MPRQKLTQHFVDTAKAKLNAERTFFWDTSLPGFALMVTAAGHKSFVYQYRAGEKTRRRAFKHGLPLADARKEARAVLGDVARGRDPVADQQKDEAAKVTVGDIIESFISRHVEKSGLRSSGKIKRLLAQHVLPRWQHRPIHEIRRGDIAALLDHVEDTSGARTADYVLSILRKIANWYTPRDNDFVSPIVPGMRRTDPKKRRRTRVIGQIIHSPQEKEWDDDELRSFWRACNELGTFGAFLKIALLTGQRREKVATMKWSDIRNGVWTIATKEREKGNAGSLHLPPQVLKILNSLPRRLGSPYVFTGRGTGPAGAFSRKKARLDALMPAGTPPFVIHDVRRSSRSLMARAGVTPHTAERVLGHALPTIEGTYDHHDYNPEKADALRRLADLVDDIVTQPGAGARRSAS